MFSIQSIWGTCAILLLLSPIMLLINEINFMICVDIGYIGFASSLSFELWVRTAREKREKANEEKKQTV